MSTNKQGEPDPDMREDYDFSRGQRGKYAKRFTVGSNVVVLDPDIAKRFADSTSVNEALRSFLDGGRVKPSGA